ncbi:MAG: GspH/FimT family pseudopilin [Pseudomonadota bacterium]
MSHTRKSGFTMVEMMVALLVLAVLLVLSAPGLTDLIKNNRMLSYVYSVRAALNGARAEAIAQRNSVTLCRSADGQTCATAAGDWNTGFVAFLDSDGDNAVDDPNELIVISQVIDEDSLTMVYSAGDAVRFDSRGYAAPGTQGTFTVCDDRGADYARGVRVSAGGVVTAIDPNDPSTTFTCP